MAHSHFHAVSELLGLSALRCARGEVLVRIVCREHTTVTPLSQAWNLSGTSLLPIDLEVGIEADWIGFNPVRLVCPSASPLSPAVSSPPAAHLKGVWAVHTHASHLLAATGNRKLKTNALWYWLMLPDKANVLVSTLGVIEYYVCNWTHGAAANLWYRVIWYKTK